MVDNLILYGYYSLSYQLKEKTMIPCWDKLEGYTLIKSGNLVNKKVKVNRTLYIKDCPVCNEEFITGHGRSVCCSSRCSRTGERNPLFGKKTKGFTGRKHTQETKDKIKEANTGENGPFYNRKHTLETRMKISDSWKQPNRSERIAKMSKSMTGKLVGDKNPSWRGGIGRDGYCFIFKNREFKKLVKERDDFQCLNCGKTNDLTVHHIDYNKLHCEVPNLATLCRSCNGKANFNRELHQEHYQKLLNELYGYEYGNDNSIKKE